jgi:hypothetical protein
LPRKVVYLERQVSRIVGVWFYCVSADKVTGKMEVLRLARSWQHYLRRTELARHQTKLNSK